MDRNAIYQYSLKVLECQLEPLQDAKERSDKVWWSPEIDLEQSSRDKKKILIR